MVRRPSKTMPLFEDSGRPLEISNGAFVSRYSTAALGRDPALAVERNRVRVERNRVREELSLILEIVAL